MFTQPAPPQLLSVIVPCRTEAAHIDAFCDSALQQQLPPGWQMEVLVADGCSDDGTRERLQQRCAANPRLRWVDNHGRPATTYPANPNGSPAGITGLTTTDGRVTILMPHPERVFRTVQNSWHPWDWAEDGGWTRMFRNARVWVD